MTAQVTEREPVGPDTEPTGGGWRSRIGREDLPLLLGLPLVCAIIIAGWVTWRINANLDDIEARALNWTALGTLVRQHLVLTAVAALAVVLTAIPTGILLTRPGIERAAPLVVGFANAGQAAPVIGIIVLLAMWLSFGSGQPCSR